MQFNVCPVCHAASCDIQGAVCQICSTVVIPYKAECCTCGASSGDPNQEYCYVCGNGMVPLPLTLEQKRVIREVNRPCNCGSGVDWALCQGNPWDETSYCG